METTPFVTVQLREGSKVNQTAPEDSSENPKTRNPNSHKSPTPLKIKILNPEINSKSSHQNRLSKMFFFFVGGLEQQVRQVLKSNAARCINCGSAADLVDYDNVLKMFFIPVWRWPGKEPLMHCNNCSFFFPRSLSSPPPPPRAGAILDVVKCRFCERGVDREFSFCPYCGASL